MHFLSSHNLISSSGVFSIRSLTRCVITRIISITLLVYPGLGLALSEWDKWWSFKLHSSLLLFILSSVLATMITSLLLLISNLYSTVARL